MSTRTPTVPAAMNAGELVAQLQANSLLRDGPYTLSSGSITPYLVDVKKTSLTPSGFRALREAVRPRFREFGATAVGGLTLGADAIAYAAVATGENVKGFVVRKEPKAHGRQLLIEGPDLDPETDRCLIVDDVVTTGTSTIRAIQAVQDLGIEICGVLCVVDRLRGGGERIAEASGAPYVALTTINDVYPERPDR
ncbi:MAG: phosphoribosyltransferase [Actinomycetota bacterium]|nr:phosphoribosyltransferase [Actinomycetota bacterium]